MAGKKSSWHDGPGGQPPLIAIGDGPREDPELAAALEASRREAASADTGEAVCAGTLVAEAAERERGLPCGLRNIGNTCHANSFLQTLLHVDDFSDRLQALWPKPTMSTKPHAEPEAEQGTGEEATLVTKRREHSIRLVRELQHLCAYGLFTMRTYMDPTRLLNELVDEQGQEMPIGSQGDVGEFMLKFLARLDEGICAMDGEATARGGAEEGTGAAQQPRQQPDEVVEKPSRPSPIKALFFGDQVQVFSYREGVPRPLAEGNAGSAQPPSDQVHGFPAVPVEAVGTVPPPLPVLATAPMAPGESTGSLVTSEEKNEFNQIFLDVKYRDLYSAWEAATRTEVDYKTPSGETTTATSSFWIERLPKLLFFQLQRVVFDQEKKAQVKVDEAFEFDETIYVDRFLLENREAATKIAAQVRDLRQQREALLKALAQFEDYQGRSGLGVSDVLGWAADCLQDNAKPKSTQLEPSSSLRLDLSQPHHLAEAGLPEAMALQDKIAASGETTVHLLRALQEACKTQEAMLREEADRLAASIGSAHKDMRRSPYELYAIWIHQGIAGSGHYWAYLRDWQHDRWIRYDDALTSVVSWDDVRTAAVGQAGSNTSAYVLVYLHQELATQQRQPRDATVVLQEAEALLPQRLLSEIHRDNVALREENARAKEQEAEQELRQHAQAIFQTYAGHIHRWDPQKTQADLSGNPHDPAARKSMYDSALLSFELFLYRLHGEQDVWTYLMAQSIDEQKQERRWVAAPGCDDEGRILYFLLLTLREQMVYSNMLVEEMDGGSSTRRCRFQPLDMTKLTAQYYMVLVQAHIVDKALQALKDDAAELVRSISTLAFVWARWNLEADDKLRQNEVLLVMSTLIYNTVNVLVDYKPRLEAGLDSFRPHCEYFLLLLYAVEWPNSWKQPVIGRIQQLFPQLARRAGGGEQVTKDAILHHQLTKEAEQQCEACMVKFPEPSKEFFDRHRELYRWVMGSDEANTKTETRAEAVARDFVQALLGRAPAVP